MARKRKMATSLRHRKSLASRHKEKKLKAGKRIEKAKAPKPKKTAKKQTSIKAEAFLPEGVSDFEDIIAMNMAKKQDAKMPKSALMAMEALYSSSAGLERLIYKHGFSLGKNIYAKSNGTIDALLAVLENGGLENVLYYPFNDSFVITAKSSNAKNLHRKMHVYESGLIAGYLSSATELPIQVKEIECEYNGDGRCRFVSYVGAQNEEEAESLDFEKIVSNISEIAKVEGSISPSYFASAILPVANHASAGPLSNFFYIAGSKLANSLKLEEIAKLAGASSVKVAKAYRNIPRLVKVRYAPESSMGLYVDAATAALKGYIKQRYGYELEAKRRIMKDNSYMVELHAKPTNYKKV